MDRKWKPVSLPGLIAWIIFYCAFLLYAATNQTGFLFIDNVNLVVHEGGHLLFGWFGYSIGIWGGTLLQWLVPLLIAAFFSSSVKLLDSFSALSSFSRTGFTPRPTWPMRAPWFCPS